MSSISNLESHHHNGRFILHLCWVQHLLLVSSDDGYLLQWKAWILTFRHALGLAIDAWHVLTIRLTHAPGSSSTRIYPHHHRMCHYRMMRNTVYGYLCRPSMEVQTCTSPLDGSEMRHTLCHIGGMLSLSGLFSPCLTIKYWKMRLSNIFVNNFTHKTDYRPWTSSCLTTLTYWKLC